MKQLTLIDFKTSKAWYPEFAMQLTAYGRAYNKQALKDGKPTVARLGGLRLDKQTGIPEYVDCTEGDIDRWIGFCSLLQYYHVMVEPYVKEGENARFYDAGEFKVPSVTTTLGILSKPALVPWAAKMTSDFISANMSEIRDPKTTNERVEQILNKSKSAHRVSAKEAAGVGTQVHEAIETYLRGGKPEPVLKDDPLAVSSFLAFLSWKDSVRLEVVGLECVVIDTNLRYGGTFDLLCYLDGEGN